MQKITNMLIMLITMNTVGHAQFFIEGSLGASYSVNKGTGGNNSESTSLLNFGVAPKVGYWLNDQLAAGIYMSYNRSNQTNRYRNNPDQEKQWQKSFSSQFGFSVFSRYRLFYIKKFSVLAESSFGISKGIAKAKSTPTSVAIFNSSSYTSMNINVYPVVSYDLTDRISILTICDFVRLGFNTGTAKFESTGIKNSSSVFVFNTGSNILNSLADVRVGFIYKLRK